MAKTTVRTQRIKPGTYLITPVSLKKNSDSKRTSTRKKAEGKRRGGKK